MESGGNIPAWWESGDNSPAWWESGGNIPAWWRVVAIFPPGGEWWQHSCLVESGGNIPAWWESGGNIPPCLPAVAIPLTADEELWQCAQEPGGQDSRCMTGGETTTATAREKGGDEPFSLLQRSASKGSIHTLRLLLAGTE